MCIIYFSEFWLTSSRFLWSINSLEHTIECIAKATKKCLSPSHLFSAPFLSSFTCSSSEVNKKDFTYRKQHFRLRNPGTTRSFLSRDKKSKKRVASSKKQVDTRNGSNVFAVSYLQFSGIFCYFLIYNTFRLLVRDACIVRERISPNKFQIYLCNWIDLNIKSTTNKKCGIFNVQFSFLK